MSESAIRPIVKNNAEITPTHPPSIYNVKWTLIVILRKTHSFLVYKILYLICKNKNKLLLYD